MKRQMRLVGKVIRGAGRGRGLGFPTANIDAVPDVEEGIYIGYANGMPSLIFVGAAETFDETAKRVEVYILDFDGDLYGQELDVRIVKKIRGNQKFESGEALIEQMKDDEREARACLA